MKSNYFLLCVCLLFSAFSAIAQVNVVEGYVYEDGNRGFLNQVNIEIVNKANGVIVFTGETNKDGFFQTEVPINGNYVVTATKQLFFKKSEEFTSSGQDGEKKFVKVKMLREPGYDFEVTLAPKRDSDDIPVDAIIGAWIEVYNNTTKKEVLNLKDHPKLDFNVHFDQGNHYTIMIRKDGFLTKRMEAYVNVEGCILCFDGVGSVQPGVTDNLSDKNSMGVLLANVELDPLFNGKTFTVENIFYDLGKATLRPKAKEALKSLATVISDNPQIKVELGAHTDSRGTAASNLDLSKRRAKAAVDYLVNTLDVSPNQIISAGFGETSLKNKCADGVDCSEAEHQINRRTEIRVLNVDKSKTNLKPLAEIRVEEEFLKSIFDGEGETKTINELPSKIDGSSGNDQQINQAEYEKQLQQQEKAKMETEQVQIENSNEEKLNQEKIAAEKIAAEKMAAEKMAAEKMAAEKMAAEKMAAEKMAAEKMAAEKMAVEKMAAEKMAAEKMAAEKMAAEKMAAEKMAAEKMAAEKMAAEKMAAEKMAAEKMAAEKTEVKETMEVLENGLPVYNGEVKRRETKPKIQTKVSTDNFGNVMEQQKSYEEIQKERNPLFNYTGYRIVIHFSQDPISQDSDIFKRHSDLVEYRSKSGSVLYMIGDYDSVEDADDFIVKTVGQVYPGAYIVGFKNGKRLN